MLNRLIRILGVITTIYLLVISVFRTCLMQQNEQGERYNAFLSDAWYLHIVVIAILLLLLWRFNALLSGGSEHIVRHAAGIACLIYAVCGLVLILTSRLEPISDCAKVMNAAQELLAGDVHAFLPDGYMGRYPFQRGLLLLDLGCILLFGDNAYLVLQILNLAALVGTLLCMTWLVQRIWSNSAISLLTILLQLLFLPLFLHITYNYGILYGIALSMLAICLAYYAWSEARHHYYVLSAVSMTLAIELKQNSLIWLIGLSMVLLAVAIPMLRENRQRGRMGILAVVLMIVMMRLTSMGSGAMIERLSGVPLSQGMPKTCWIYMALQDDDDRPGAYNGNSTSLYEECGYDYDTANEEAIHRIVQLFGYMASRPVATVRQFTRKIAYEWNNPTFESLDILQRDEAVYGEQSGLAHVILLQGVRQLVTQYMNLLQTVILLFSVAGAFTIWRRRGEWWEILLLTIFVGGFAFHLFWEAKPQYTLPYFLLLIPYAALGMVQIGEWMIRRETHAR